MVIDPKLLTREILLGFWKVQLWNVYYYVKEARKPQTVA